MLLKRVHGRAPRRADFRFYPNSIKKSLCIGRSSAGHIAATFICEHMFVGTRPYRETIDWAAVQVYHDAGHGFVACQKKFGFTHGAWNKAISRGRLRTAPTPFRDRRRKYDWTEVQRYHDEGHSARACCRRFGFCIEAWFKAKKRGELRTRPLALPLHVILQRSRVRCTIKRRLLQAGVLVNRCDECQISEWRGKPLSIQIDHINGKRDDHRVENLRMLCPNCHSQTDTFAARNRRKIKPFPVSLAGRAPGSGPGCRGSSP